MAMHPLPDADRPRHRRLVSPPTTCEQLVGLLKRRLLTGASARESDGRELLHIDVRRQRSTCSARTYSR